jgi:hypothetical protein
MHLNWANTTVLFLLAGRVWYAIVTNGRPIYEPSAKRGILWVGMIFVLLWVGGFWR